MDVLRTESTNPAMNCSNTDAKTESESACDNNSTETEYFEFDGRPYKYTHFEQPDSHDLEEISKFATDKLKLNGYCVIERLFDDKLLEKVIQEFERASLDGSMVLGQISGGKTSGEENLMKTKAEIRNDKIAWVEGTEPDIPATKKVIGTLDDIVNRFNQHLEGQCLIEGRTKAMMACYPGGGSFYRRHVDNPSKDGRVITCILYLNKGWDVEQDGGMLRILPADSGDQVDIHVAPVANRLLFFWSDKRNPHEVHPAHRTRYALTVWYFDVEERTRTKQEHINEEMSKIQGELSLLELKTKQVEKDTLSRRISNESMKAVATLSAEELEALSVLLEGKSDPRSVLSSLGIAAGIQDALLEVIRGRNT